MAEQGDQDVTFECRWGDIVLCLDPITAWGFYRTCKDALSMYRTVRSCSVKAFNLVGMEQYALLADWMYRRLVTEKHYDICIPRSYRISHVCLCVMRKLLREGKRVALLNLPYELRSADDVFATRSSPFYPGYDVRPHLNSKIIAGSAYTFRDHMDKLEFDYVITLSYPYYQIDTRTGCHHLRLSFCLERNLEYDWMVSPRSKFASFDIIRDSQLHKFTTRDAKKYRHVISYSCKVLTEKTNETDSGSTRFFRAPLSGVDNFLDHGGTIAAHSWNDVATLVSKLPGVYSLYVRIMWRDRWPDKEIGMLPRLPEKLTLVYNDSREYVVCKLFLPHMIHYDCENLCIKAHVAQLRRGLGNAFYALTYWEIKYMFTWNGLDTHRDYQRQQVLNQPATTIPMEVMDKIAQDV